MEKNIVNEKTKGPKSAAMKAICDIEHIFSHKMRAKCKDFGLKDNYMRIISYLSKHDGVSQLELVKFTGFRASTISVTLQNMEKDGFITRIQDAIDSRIMLVYLSQRGKEIDQSVIGEISSVENEIMQSISDSEAESLNRLLDKIKYNI